MKINKIILISLLLTIIIIGLSCIFKKQPKETIKLKKNYTVEEILDKINKNYSKIKTIQMTFKNTLFNEPEKGKIVNLKSGKSKLFHVIQGDNIKIEGKNVEILKDPKLGIIGNYKKQSLKIQYNHLTIWLAGVYRRALLYPIELNELKYYNVKMKKLKTEGYYKLFFSPKNQKDLFVTEITVNMQYGVVEKIIIKQNKDESLGINETYTIKAKLSKFDKFNNIYFPKKAYIKYNSEIENYFFKTEIKKICFNKKIEDSVFEFTKKNEVTWYTDPIFLDNSTLLMIKGTGRLIRTILLESQIINKHYYLIKMNIENKKEKNIKHLFSFRDDTYSTKFFFTANYNKKYNLISYAISESQLNRNKDLKKYAGLYLYNLNSKKTIKISDKGFLPLWSDNNKSLIWGQASKKGVNDIWICNYKGENKKLLIKNGFFYNWGKDNKTIIFERGWWVMGQGHYLPYNLTNEDIKGGIYCYHFTNKKTNLLSNTGFFPNISDDKKHLIFSDRLKQSGIYQLDLSSNDIKKIIDIKPSHDIHRAFWHGDKILYIKTDSLDRNKQGLYSYSLSGESYRFISNKIIFNGLSSVFLDVTFDKQYLLYKFYSLPLWEDCEWGIYNLKKEKLICDTKD